MAEVGYRLRDVNNTLYEFIRNRNITVEQEGKEVRVKTFIGTPNEAISKKTYPLIFINPGFMANQPGIWRIPEVVDYQLSSENEAIIGKCVSSVRNVFFTYQIGFLVEYSQHRDYLTEEFIDMFPLELYLPFKDAQGVDYKFVFKHDGKYIPLDYIQDNKNIIRRDITMTIKLAFGSEVITEELYAFGGVELQMYDFLVGGE